MSSQWNIIPDEITIKLLQKSRLVMILEGRIEVLGGKWFDFFLFEERDDRFLPNHVKEGSLGGLH